jgi:hypothetical protein
MVVSATFVNSVKHKRWLHRDNLARCWVLSVHFTLAMIMAAVEEVQQRAKEQESVWNQTEKVGAVFRPKQVGRDQHRRYDCQYPSAFA